MTGSSAEPAGRAPDPGPAAGSFALPPGSCVIVTTALPSEAEAGRIASAVVEEQLAACAQCQGPIRSTYRWQGTVEQSTEWYVHCKTAASRMEALVARIRALHPYKVPEIIATPILGGHPDYLAWVERESQK